MLTPAKRFQKKIVTEKLPKYQDGIFDPTSPRITSESPLDHWWIDGRIPLADPLLDGITCTGFPSVCQRRTWITR